MRIGTGETSASKAHRSRANKAKTRRTASPEQTSLGESATERDPVLADREANRRTRRKKPDCLRVRKHSRPQRYARDGRSRGEPKRMPRSMNRCVPSRRTCPAIAPQKIPRSGARDNKEGYRSGRATGRSIGDNHTLPCSRVGNRRYTKSSGRADSGLYGHQGKGSAEMLPE